MSSSSDVIVGHPSKDLSVTNLFFASKLTQCGGNIRAKTIDACSLISLKAAVENFVAISSSIDNLTVNNNLNSPPPSYLALRTNGPTPGDAAVDVVSSIYTNPAPVPDIKFTGSIQLPLAIPVSSSGSNVIQVGNGFQVLQNGLYNVSYRSILRTYIQELSLGTKVAGSVGTYGSAFPNDNVSAIVWVGVVVNNNYNDSLDQVYAPSVRFFGLSDNPLFTGSVNLPLNAGDTISLRTYSAHAGTPPTDVVQFETAEMTLVQL